jgi:hypothetical protein
MVAMAVWSLPFEVAAHEPIYGLGPHTLFEGGLGTSLGVDYAAAEIDGTSALLGLTYGLTANHNIAVALPVALSVPIEEETVSGVGGPVIQFKWRALVDLSLGRVDALALIGGIRLPTGSRALSQGSTGYVLGLTAAREDQRYYLFQTVRYLTQTVGLSGQPGDAFLFDSAVGVRPFILEYDDPDLVLLVELNGMLTRDARPLEPSETDVEQVLVRERTKHAGGATQFAAAGSPGGLSLAVTPEILLSLGNVMWRLGVQIPVYRDDVLPAGPDFRIRNDLIVQF